MGHKVHPTGFRIGIIRDWQAKWYADKQYAAFLQEDLKLRRAIWSKYVDAGISLVQIDRQANEISVTIYTSRPGVVIGRGGQRVDEVRSYLEDLIGKKIRLNIQEVRQPELDAFLVARAIAEQIERRIAYRRAMKQTIFRTIQAGAKGIRVCCAGRLGGAEIARIEAAVSAEPAGVVEPAAEEAEEKAAEPVAEKVVETAPSAEVEEKPKKPVRRRKKAESAVESEEKAVEAVAEEVVETAPSAEVEGKPKKPARRRKKAESAVESEEKAVEAVAEEVVETAPSAEAEEKPKKPARRRKKAADTAATPVESEEQGATTETS